MTIQHDVSFYCFLNYISRTWHDSNWRHEDKQLKVAIISESTDPKYNFDLMSTNDIFKTDGRSPLRTKWAFLSPYTNNKTKRTYKRPFQKRTYLAPYADARGLEAGSKQLGQRSLKRGQSLLCTSCLVLHSRRDWWRRIIWPISGGSLWYFLCFWEREEIQCVLYRSLRTAGADWEVSFDTLEREVAEVYRLQRKEERYSELLWDVQEMRVWELDLRKMTMIWCQMMMMRWTVMKWMMNMKRSAKFWQKARNHLLRARIWYGTICLNVTFIDSQASCMWLLPNRTFLSPSLLLFLKIQNVFLMSPNEKKNQKGTQINKKRSREVKNQRTKELIYHVWKKETWITLCGFKQASRLHPCSQSLQTPYCNIISYPFKC